MKTNLFKNLFRSALITSGLLVAGAVHAYTLPAVSPCNFNAIDPNIPSNLLCTTDPGTGAKIYVGSSHDNFISYGVNNLNYFANLYNGAYTSLSDWSSLQSFGSGQIVKLFSFNNSNNTIDGVTYPDATAGTGDNKTGVGADQTPKNDGNYIGDYPASGSMTIAMLKAYLGAGNTTPVFGFDLNNNNQTMNLSGYLQVQRNGVAQKSWAFDNKTNGLFDGSLQDSVTALADQFVLWQDAARCPPPAYLCSATVSNSVGSGKADFLGYTPDFNVNDWQDTDTLYFYWKMWGLVAGGEELSLTNQVVPPGTVPEPSVLMLLGLGLLGLGVARRKLN